MHARTPPCSPVWKAPIRSLALPWSRSLVHGNSVGHRGERLRQLLLIAGFEDEIAATSSTDECCAGKAVGLQFGCDREPVLLEASLDGMRPLVGDDEVDPGVADLLIARRHEVLVPGDEVLAGAVERVERDGLLIGARGAIVTDVPADDDGRPIAATELVGEGAEPEATRRPNRGALVGR